MKYRAKDATNAIPAGTYEATIRSVVTSKDDGSPLVDKNGNEYINVVYDVWVGEHARQLTEYHSASPTSLWKYAKLADALGARDEFRAETFDVANYVGKNLFLELTVKDHPEYGEQNRVKSYGANNSKAKASTGVATTPKSAPAALKDDDIPF